MLEVGKELWSADARMGMTTTHPPLYEIPQAILGVVVDRKELCLFV